MNDRASGCCKALFVGAFCLVVLAAGAGASESLGVFCLDVTMDGETETGRSELTVSSVGDGNYLLNGTTGNSSATGIGSVIGSGSVVGPRVLITLHKSHVDEYGMSVSTAHIDLSSATLEGTFHSIAQDWSGGFEPLNYASGTAKLAPCN
jgi:hypothetical protein